MTKLAIGMTCAPRQVGDYQYKYAHRAIASLRTAGFTEQLHVFAEPGTLAGGYLPDPAKYDVAVHENKERLWCFGNWKHGLNWLLANVDADWYLLLQDDTIWKANGQPLLTAAMTAGKFANVGFLSPYTSKSMVGNMKAKGWATAKFYRRAFWGALAVCMPKQSAAALAAFPRFNNHKHRRKLDVVIGNCFRDMHKPVMVHVPSLCDHIGEWSTLGRHRLKNNQWARRGFKFSNK